MQKEFTKADLKDGMVVEERRGVIGFVLREKFCTKMVGTVLFMGRRFRTNNNNDNFDIIKVYKIKIEYAFKLSNILNIENLELIWERGETKRMTAEEMRQKLEELTGEKIEPSREEMVGACYEYCRDYPVMFCKYCPLREVGNCKFYKYTDEQLEEAYKKVIANGK